MDEFPELEHIRISNRGDGFQNTVARNGPAVYNINYVGLSVFHENLNLSNFWYDYDVFYFDTEIEISKQLSNFL